MAKAEMTVHVADLPRVKSLVDRLEHRVECLEAMLRRPTCSQCGQTWAEPACGPTHAAIFACRPKEMDHE